MRKPTENELKDLLKYTADMSFASDTESAKDVVDNAYICVFDNYVTGGPADCGGGKVMIVLWDGSISQYEAYTWRDGKFQYETQDGDLARSHINIEKVINGRTQKVLIRDVVNEKIDNMFSDLCFYYRLKSGDFGFEDEIELDKIKSKLEETLNRYVDYNKERKKGKQCSTRVVKPGKVQEKCKINKKNIAKSVEATYARIMESFKNSKDKTKAIANLSLFELVLETMERQFKDKFK